MYLKNEPKIEPFDPRPGEKIHFFQNCVYRCYTQKRREKCEMSLFYTITIVLDRKIFESFPGIPGNGNEKNFLRTKAYFYVFQRFILSFHDFIQAVGPNTRPTCQI